MKVHIRKKKLSGNKVSLFLDITGNGRHKEYLKMSLFLKPKNYIEKKHNEETMRQAEDIRAGRQLELQAQSHGLDYVAPTNQTFDDFFLEFIKNYPNKDINKYKATYAHYKDFNGDKPIFLNQKYADDFSKYLKNDCDLHGETPFQYYSRFKKICALAYRKRIIKIDPLQLTWKLKYDKGAFRKEVLSVEDLNKLAKAYCGNENVKRLFLFCCNTGLRFGDAKKLTWGDIKNNRIGIEQGKTGKYVYVDLNSNAKKIIGRPGKATNPVFDLRGIDGINKVILNWYKKAEINKHITTHSARHTFCTMLMQRKIDPRTIIGLMGWSEGSGMRQLMRYAHLVDESIKLAVDSLPEIFYK